MKYYYPLSTGNISKYCHMSTSTVRKWIKSGRLRAYTTPDGQYRVELVDFKEFLERYGMPIRVGFFEDDGKGQEM